MSLNPRKQFQSSYGKSWPDLTASSQFVDACEKSLLILQQNLAVSNDPTMAGANYFRMKGAQEVIDILLSLGEPEQKPKPKPDYNLPTNSTR